MSLLSQFFGGSEQIPIEVFAVGGGGGGLVAPNGGGGGGGAGQVQYARTLIPTKVTFNITIGAGGAVGSYGSSTIFSNIISYGGASSVPAGVTGGSGSGATGGSVPAAANPSFWIKSFTTTGYTAVNDGAAALPNQGGGGGGGSLTAGNPPPGPGIGGAGGGGIPAPSPLNIISLAVGGGGGGGGGPVAPGAVGGAGGAGGGGTGGPSPSKDGTANTGGGGGGGASAGQQGGGGGSGLLVIRYPTGFAAATVTGNAPTPAQPGYNVYRWNSGPGTITFN